MGNNKSRITYNPNETLREDATFLVQGGFGSKQLKLNDSMIVEDLDPLVPRTESSLGNIFYNKFRDTFTYLGYNGNIRSNIIKFHDGTIKPNYDNFNRNFLLKRKEIDYVKIQNDFVESRILEGVSESLETPSETPSEIPNIYVINLKHREDRRVQIEKDFKELGYNKVLNLKYFEAIKHKNGWMGCALSHLYLISYALENNLPYIIIAEDDFQLKVSSEKLKEILDSLTEIEKKNPGSWDIFNGSPSFYEKESKNETIKFYNFPNNSSTENQNFLKVNWGQSTSFMIYNASSYIKMLNYSFKNKEYQIDQYISRNFLQVVYRNGPFSIQRQSYSDISNFSTGEDYEKLFLGYAEMISKAVPNSEEKTIGVYTIYVDQYSKFYGNLIKNCEDFFLPQYKKYYYIATDKEDLIKPKGLEDRIFFLKINKIGWPYETLYRFKYFLMFNREDVNKSDVIYFINGNGQFVKNIGKEVLPNESGYVFTKHHGYVNKNYDKLGFEKKHSNSTAFIPKSIKKYTYYAGGFYGATKDKYLEMCKSLDENISIDEGKGYIAVWHDESHINHYCNIFLNQKFKKLDIDFHIPQEKIRNYNNISLIYLDKKIYLEQNSNVKNLSKCNKNVNGEIIINDYNKKFLSDSPSNFSLAFKYEYNVGGLGDMIRGMVNCLVLSKIFKVPLYFDINHPIGNHFIYNSIPLKKEKLEFDLIDYTLHSSTNERLENLLENLFYKKYKFNDKCIVMKNNITFCEKIKKYNDCEEIYKQSYKEIFEIFKPKSYLITHEVPFGTNIIHIRFGDKYLNEATASKSDDRSGDPNKVKNELLEVYEKFGKCKIVSDNLELLRNFGDDFNSKSSKFEIETRPSIHFAYENTKNIDIIPTLQTFFDFKKYKQIIVKSYSGFSFLASLCFDISYVNFNGEKAEFTQAIL